MKKVLCALLAVMMIAGCSFADDEAEPVRLGIMRFSSKTYDVPDGMAAVIGDFFGRMLFKSEGIQLLERDRLEAVGSEINLGMSGLIDNRTAARVGKLAGCQYILLGSITNLARGASGMAVPLMVLPIAVGNAKQKVKATLDVRVIDTETAAVVFADGADGEASKSDNITTFYGISFADSEFGGIENVAIAQAVAKLAPGIEKALTGKDTLTEILTPTPKKGKKAAKEKAPVSSSKSKSSRKKSEGQTAPQAEDTPAPVKTSGFAAASVPAAATTPKFENNSTDPAKVVQSYGLPSGEANTLRVKHINAAKLGNGKKAYDAYTSMFEENSNDYLAAFRAGEIARSMKKKDDARTWFERALDINPDYVPAQRALSRL